MTHAQDQLIRVLALTRNTRSASFEQRIAGYVSMLAEKGIEVTIELWPHRWRAQKRMLTYASTFDCVWWQRYLPVPWIAPMIRKHVRKLVFDFDDPVLYSSRGGGRPSFSRRLRFASILRRSDVALVASEHLAQFARVHCEDVRILPMPIDLPVEPRFDRPVASKIELVWIGSASTQPYLELIRPVLQLLGAQRDDIRLRLVAHEPMQFGSLEVDFRKWSINEQDTALQQCHIGLCPMPDTLWTQGKCPYKVLQYMAWGMPWVGSAVGENLTTAGDGRGRCASDDDQWLSHIIQLADDADLRCNMGQRCRTYIEEHHDRNLIGEQLCAIWQELSQS